MTGPIIAVALVLCAVFVPCAFISGITGQFFRQFAVTIAVSTIISAINAVTMTPSRAVLIFKSGDAAHEHKPEALPWWAFAGGGLLRSGSCRSAGPGRVGIGRRAGRGGRRLCVVGDLVSPRRDCRRGGGETRDPARERRAALVVPGLQSRFRLVTDAYGWAVGKLLRLSAVVLLAYGCLLFLTTGSFRRRRPASFPSKTRAG